MHTRIRFTIKIYLKSKHYWHKTLLNGEVGSKKKKTHLKSAARIAVNKYIFFTSESTQTQTQQEIK